MNFFQTIIVFFLILIAINQSMAESEQSKMSLDSITVTANKQEENLQEVPLSISVFDETTLEDKNISSISNLTEYVPNLVMYKQGVSSAGAPVMRGVSAELGTFNVSTAMFIDGVPVLTTAGYEDALQNVERIEVLRGPQGTLYGKNAHVGAINIITYQPDNTLRGKVSVDLGEDYKKNVTFNVSGPMVQDKFFFGLTGQYYEKEGFITNGYKGGSANDKAHWYGKGQLRWTPSDPLDINLIVSHLQYYDDGNDMGLSEDGAAGFGMPGVVLPSRDRTVYSDFETKEASTVSSQALKVSYDFNDTFNLTSITTHRFVDDDTAYDWDFNAVPLMPAESVGDSAKISQELRLAASTDKIRWVAGFYYDRDDGTMDLSMGPFKINRDMGGTGYAIFSQLRYALTQQMGITGGLRYEKQEKDMQDALTGKSFDGSWTDIAPKISVDYALTEQVMGYATVAKGFLPGGFNPMSLDSGYDSYDSEELWSYEVGVKSQFFGNRLIVNSALFYMDIDDMHVTESVEPFVYISNAGSATSYGVELEVLARITPQFTMNGSFGYTNTKFDEYFDDAGDYSDNRVPVAPEYTFTIGGQYRAKNGFYAGADLVTVGKTYLERTNTYERDAYQLINAKIGYESEIWDIYLYGKNIFDEDYSSIGNNYIIYSDPREIGVKLTYRF